VNKVFAFLGNIEKMIVAVLVLGLSLGIAASPVIGTAQSAGRFQIDNSPVSGSATVFEGSRIESRSGAPRIDLRGGPSFEFTSDTRATLYGDHAVLEQGGGVMASNSQAAPFRVLARSLSVQSAEPGGSARVQLSGTTRVQVSALRGGVRVKNAQGMLVATVAPGSAMEFDPQVGATNKTRVSGCLQKRANGFLLTDETTSVTVELRGAGLDREVGNNVVVNGTMEAVADSQAVNVSSIERVGKGCSGRLTKAAGGGKDGAAASAGAGGTVSSGWALSGTTIAIIGGVAAAGTIGGLAALDKLPGQGNTISK